MAIPLIDRLKALGLDVITITNLDSVKNLGYNSFNELLEALEKLESEKKVSVIVRSVLEDHKTMTPIMCCEVNRITDIHDFQNELDNLKAITIEIH